jgi:hypothetical protein
MPVEIKELVIRATVTTQEDRSSSTDANTEAEATLTEAERSIIVRAAVEEVLRIMRASKER